MEKEHRKMILSAAIMAVVAAMLLIYSAFAWMTISRTVSARGVELKATVPDDLLISLTGNNDDWHDSVTINMKDVVESQGIAGYDASKEFYLLPASTFAGFTDATNNINTIFSTIHAYTDGTAYDEPFEYAHYVAFNPSTNQYEGHYVDVPLYFKTSTDSAVENGLDLHLIKTIGSETVTSVEPLTGDTSKVENTVRVAFLNEDLNKNSSGGSAPLVYAQNYDDPIDNPLVITGIENNNGNKKQAVYMRFTNNLSVDKLLTLTKADYSGQGEIYSVSRLTVRIWIEGQDKDCIATIGGKSFNVNLGFARADYDQQ